MIKIISGIVREETEGESNWTEHDVILASEAAGWLSLGFRSRHTIERSEK